MLNLKIIILRKDREEARLNTVFPYTRSPSDDGYARLHLLLAEPPNLCIRPQYISSLRREDTKAAVKLVAIESDMGPERSGLPPISTI